jgi:hydrogenase maturation protein HypF
MSCQRARIAVSGAVQGVGFRPFVYRLANELRLSGWVANSAQGVLIESEGEENRLAEFITRLETEKPRHALIHELQHSCVAPVHDRGFEIRESAANGATTAFIMPDLATCEHCLRELFDPTDRRYLYPFINCTHCGPRFSIIEALPYDRPNTSMKRFALCAECEREYDDPANRRFHAQPNACPRCGPRLELWDRSGVVLYSQNEALLATAAAIRRGEIVALKGIGGFQLIVDARNDDAINRLRASKRREEKPFAVMFPSVQAIEACCCLGDLERRLLLSPASPIVLARKVSTERTMAASVAPDNPFLGLMLPYSPLHHLLLRLLEFPIVATSGNLSDEPICTDEREALRRLAEIAGLFLVHNRPIVRHVDDSVVRIIAGREMILRRARGFAPLPIELPSPLPLSDSGSATQTVCPILAVGAHLKNSVALGLGTQAFLGQHIGDLQTVEAYSSFQRSAVDLPHLYDAPAQIIAHDLHPDYLSTKFALDLATASATNTGGQPHAVPVQHHYAHVLSCMAENELASPALGVAWDGTGFGTDGTIWGGEFLSINETSFERFAHFRQFRLPGGDAAAKQPRRSALGLLYEIFGSDLFRQTGSPGLLHFSPTELRMLEPMLAEGINSPVTSSAGRFFDAIASLLELRPNSTFEAQAAMELEFAAAPGINDSYPFHLSNGRPAVFDWQPMILQILHELRQGQCCAIISAKIHNTLVQLIVAVAHRAGEQDVLLSGGCFQNQYLTERAIRRLREEGFTPYWHSQVPPNDGGIALGQVMAARLQTMKQSNGSAAQGPFLAVSPLRARVDRPLPRYYIASPFRARPLPR